MNWKQELEKEEFVFQGNHWIKRWNEERPCAVIAVYYKRDDIWEVRGHLPEDCNSEGVLLFDMATETELIEAIKEMVLRVNATMRLTSSKT